MAIRFWDPLGEIKLYARKKFPKGSGPHVTIRRLGAGTYTQVGAVSMEGIQFVEEMEKKP